MGVILPRSECSYNIHITTMTNELHNAEVEYCRDGGRSLSEFYVNGVPALHQKSIHKEKKSSAQTTRFLSADAPKRRYKTENLLIKDLFRRKLTLGRR
ncbi:hypothetical protein AVEN_131912-1 [Araneus ventricosus]|uniref:Uncharacterized protein n=1 Tax=Araneus ventricosus TaxID=182803 RepID=A0A4Y2F2M2_ARAVE|nr:hypothetical protein AVEN_271610-1 [Araneus ventricosus]GBM35653.1 hypothetical protein AVEN_72099-1 [Araneus ventricosus]GBM35660.1 hypothetical protein AVEN_88305-1 [Araneus ventricosus]GBM35667.1 hypothetical protein AVEN_131912-1 [Araneus ventricosus]